MATNTNIKLKEGEAAPDFTALTNGDEEISLSQFRGQTVVLYFYPKDNTPGCNKEACGFRDVHTEIVAKNAIVLGVSADSVTKHEKFIEKFELPFKLIADENKVICNAYGVWGEKKFMGRVYDGIHRMTFIIDQNGVVERVISKVKTKDHAAQILSE